MKEDEVKRSHHPKGQPPLRSSFNLIPFLKTQNTLKYPSLTLHNIIKPRDDDRGRLDSTGEALARSGCVQSRCGRLDDDISSVTRASNLHPSTSCLILPKSV